MREIWLIEYVLGMFGVWLVWLFYGFLRNLFDWDFFCVFISKILGIIVE